MEGNWIWTNGVKERFGMVLWRRTVTIVKKYSRGEQRRAEQRRTGQRREGQDKKQRKQKREWSASEKYRAVHDITRESQERKCRNRERGGKECRGGEGSVVVWREGQGRE